MVKSTGERVEDKTQFLQGYRTQKRGITGFSKHDRSVTISLRKQNVALGNIALWRPVRKSKAIPSTTGR